VLSLIGVAVFNIERRSRLILLLELLGICNTGIKVALLYMLVISVKALKLSKGGVNKAVKGVVNSVLKGVE
jgi:hypothetical protein